MRIGFGFDVHQLAGNETLWLGGLLIPHEKGTVAHSDGDVVLHALCDALLGAAKLQDIGYHFPDNSEEFKNADSKKLLAKTNELITAKGYRIGNIDITIAAQRPRLRPYIAEMETIIAGVLQIDDEQVSVKATTTEHLGFEGREEGISAYAAVLLEQ